MILKNFAAIRQRLTMTMKRTEPDVGYKCTIKYSTEPGAGAHMYNRILERSITKPNISFSSDKLLKSL